MSPRLSALPAWPTETPEPDGGAEDATALSNRPLRLALVFENAADPPEWGRRLIEQIRLAPQLELCALISPSMHPPDRVQSRLVRAWLGLERKFLARPKLADSGAFIAACDALPALPADAEVLIAKQDLDLIVDLSGGQGQACRADLARFGVWFPDFQVNEPALAGLSALLSKKRVADFALFRRKAGQADPVAIAGGAVNLKFAASRAGLFMVEKFVPFLMRELKQAHRHGQPNEAVGLELKPDYRIGLLSWAEYLASLWANLGRRGSQKVWAKLGLRPQMFFLKTSACSLDAFDPKSATPVISRTNSEYADPFLWESEGECYCFFEECDFRTGVGHISVGRFEGDELVDIRPIMRREIHLSFPFLFEDAGALYMMPETFGAGRLEVWKCAEFPDRWEPYATAFEGTYAADSTLTKVGDNWWLFTNISSEPFQDTSSELHIFQVDGPDLGNPRPHAGNPVIFDSRFARNGGRILEINGELFRVAQENSHGSYGYGLQLMKIKRLSLEEYEEEPVRRIVPDFEAGIDGCHHLDLRGGRIVMDVRKKFGGFARR